MSIIEETRDLDVLRVEEVIASVKVYDKREDLHDERDKLIGTEKAFSSLKIGNNQAYSSHKGFQGSLLKDGNHKMRGDQIHFQIET